jgi:hypothetical protein
MQDQGQQDRFRRGSLLGVVSGALLLLGCIVVAYLVANLVDLLRPGTMLRGRDFRPTAVMAAALIATAGFWWSLARGHGWAEMLASLVLTEVLLGGLIVFFSGSAAIGSFFFDWFLGVNLYFGLPWLVAIGLSLVKARRHG